MITRDPDRVGANLGTQTAFDVSGFVLGPLLAAVLAQVLGLRAPFLALAVVYGATLVVLLRLDLQTGATATVHRAVRGLMRLPAVQSALCAAIAFYLTIGMFEALWSVLLRDLGAETWLIGLTLSIFTIPMILFAPKGGALAQRKGPIKVVSVSILVAAVCTVVYGFGPLWLIIGISAIHATADAFTMPSNQVAVAIASPPDQVASGQGLLGATGLAVAGLAALVGAGVYETFGREAGVHRHRRHHGAVPAGGPLAVGGARPRPRRAHSRPGLNGPRSSGTCAHDHRNLLQNTGSDGRPWTDGAPRLDRCRPRARRRGRRRDGAAPSEGSLPRSAAHLRPRPAGGSWLSLPRAPRPTTADDDWVLEAFDADEIAELRRIDEAVRRDLARDHHAVVLARVPGEPARPSRARWWRGPRERLTLVLADGTALELDGVSQDRAVWLGYCQVQFGLVLEAIGPADASWAARLNSCGCDTPLRASRLRVS